MTLTYDEATNDMYGMLLPLWASSITTLLGSTPIVHYPGIEAINPTPIDAFWARLNRQNVIQQQVTLADANGKALFETRGLLTVQLFAPLSIMNSFGLCVQWADIILRAYRGKHSPNGVWFRDVTVKELPPDAKFHRFNVVAQYRYNEVN